MLKFATWLVSLAFTCTAQAQYVLDVRAPANAEQAVYANNMRQGDSMRNLVTLINKHVKVDREVPIIARSCGTVNAFYNPNTREVILCYELMVDSQMKRQREGINGGPLLQSIYAEAAFVLLHEVGHHLIHEYSLPVLGKEEDAADKIAAYILLASGGEAVLKRGMRSFITPPRGLFSLATSSEPDYSSVHGLPQQRLANIVCWGMGKSPAMFSDQIEVAKLSRSRLQGCTREYEMMKRDLTSLLGQRLLVAETSTAETQSNGASLRQDRGATLASENQCAACHKPRDPSVGPSLSAMAQRYDDGALRTALLRKVNQGAQGNWGSVPAPAMPSISDTDSEELSRWVASFR